MSPFRKEKGIELQPREKEGDLEIGEPPEGFELGNYKEI